MVSKGDTVRPYNMPAYTYEVVETDVDRDIEIEDAGMVIRSPNGDTLLKRKGVQATYAVFSEHLLNDAT